MSNEYRGLFSEILHQSHKTGLYPTSDTTATELQWEVYRIIAKYYRARRCLPPPLLVPHTDIRTRAPRPRTVQVATSRTDGWL